MRLIGAGEQIRLDELFDASGTSAGAGSVLALGRSYARSYLLIQNTGTGSISVEFGPARASATLTSGAVSSVTVINAGQNYSRAPIVEFLGGGGADLPYGNSSFLGLGQPAAPAPSHPARATCVMTGAAPNLSVSSITIDDPGVNYVAAPYVYLRNSRNDPNGVAIASATTGIILPAGSAPLIWNGTCCPTDQISIFTAAAGSWTIKYMT